MLLWDKSQAIWLARKTMMCRWVPITLWEGTFRQPVVIQQPLSLEQITAKGWAGRSTTKSLLQALPDPKTNCKYQHGNSLDLGFGIPMFTSQIILSFSPSPPCPFFVSDSIRSLWINTSNIKLKSTCKETRSLPPWCNSPHPLCKASCLSFQFLGKIRWSVWSCILQKPKLLTICNSSWNYDIQVGAKSG